MIQGVPVLTQLRRLRESKYLSQAMLAKKAGLDVVTISRLETGKQSATYATMHKLAEALGVEPGELVETEGK